MNRRTIPFLLGLVAAFHASELHAQVFPYTEATVEHAHDWLTVEHASWNETAVRLAHRRSVRNLGHARFRRVARFGETDLETLAGASVGLGDRWTASFEGTVVSDASFLANRSLSAHLHRSLGDGWGAQLGLSWRSYPDSDVRLVQALVERYWETFRFAYRPTRASVNGDEHGISHLLQVHRFHGERGYVALGASVGREAEIVAPGEVRALDTQAISIWGVTPLIGSLGGVYGGWWSRHGEAYTRRGARLGLSVRF